MVIDHLGSVRSQSVKHWLHLWQLFQVMHASLVTDSFPTQHKALLCPKAADYLCWGEGRKAIPASLHPTLLCWSRQHSPAQP